MTARQRPVCSDARDLPRAINCGLELMSGERYITTWHVSSSLFTLLHISCRFGRFLFLPLPDRSSCLPPQLTTLCQRIPSMGSSSQIWSPTATTPCILARIATRSPVPPSNGCYTAPGSSNPASPSSWASRLESSPQHATQKPTTSTSASAPIS